MFWKTVLTMAASGEVQRCPGNLTLCVTLLQGGGRQGVCCPPLLSSLSVRPSLWAQHLLAASVYSLLVLMAAPSSHHLVLLNFVSSDLVF